MNLRNLWLAAGIVSSAFALSELTRALSVHSLNSLLMGSFDAVCATNLMLLYFFYAKESEGRK